MGAWVIPAAPSIALGKMRPMLESRTDYYMTTMVLQGEMKAESRGAAPWQGCGGVPHTFLSLTGAQQPTGMRSGN